MVSPSMKNLLGLAALPDQPGEREGGHQRYAQGDEDRGHGHDGAVEEVFGHVPRFESAGIVGPQPVTRQTDDVVAEDLRVVLQREGEHPVDREEVVDEPENQPDIDEDPHCVGCAFHGLIPPL